MRNSGLHAMSMVVGAVMLGACATTAPPAALPASTVSLVEGSAVACLRVAQAGLASTTPDPRNVELCRLYYDLRVLRDLGRHLDEVVGPRLRITPVPCLADGPGCLWHEAYEDLFAAQSEIAFGDPSPQPSTPLPFDVIPAGVQLERALTLRKGLTQAVTDLDAEIEVLRAAVNRVGEVP